MTADEVGPAELLALLDADLGAPAGMDELRARVNRHARELRRRWGATAVVLFMLATTGLALAASGRGDELRTAGITDTTAGTTDPSTSGTTPTPPPAVSIVVDDYLEVPANPDPRGYPWTPPQTGGIGVFRFVNTTSLTVATNGRFTIERPMPHGGWVPWFRVAYSGKGDGLSEWARADGPLPGGDTPLRIEPTTSTPAVTTSLSLPHLDPGIYRVSAEITGGPEPQAFGELLVPDASGHVCCRAGRLPPPEPLEPDAFLAINQHDPTGEGSLAAILVNRTDETLTADNDVSVEQWIDDRWQPTFVLRPTVAQRVCPDATTCLPLTVPFPAGAEQHPASWVAAGSPLFVPVTTFSIQPREATVTEGISLPPLRAGRYRLTQRATTLAGKTVELHARFQTVADDPAADRPAPAAGSYDLIEVTSPIENFNREHDLLAPPHPDDPRPIPPDEIVRRNWAGPGRATLYYGRYSSDAPATAGRPDNDDTPRWLLVVDESVPAGACDAGGGPFRQGGDFDTTTTTPDPGTSTTGAACHRHVVMVIDPLTGTPTVTTMSTNG